MWIEIDDGVFAKEANNPTQIIVLSELEKQISSLKIERDKVDAKNISTDNKEYEVWFNQNKQKDIEILNKRIEDLTTIRDEIVG